jgi:transcriptional regulator with XRE-family HTH domain
MKNIRSTESFLTELGERLAAIRLSRNMTQAQLAEQAGVSKRTVERLESGSAATHLSGFVRVCRALGVLDRFDAAFPQPLPSPIAELKARKQQRQRASTRAARARAPQKWKWGDEK